MDWKFAPATRNGVPVDAVTQIDVDFKLPPPRLTKDGSQVLIMGRSLFSQGIRPPTIISRVEPEYSEEARQVHYQGTVVLQVTIDKDGTLTVGKIVRELGFGLDQKAIDALQQWKFRPATKDGEAVPVELNIDVNFELR